MSPVVACPALQTLESLLAGRLSAVETESLEDHLQTCKKCQTTIDRIVRQEDPFVAMLRAAGDAADSMNDEHRQPLNLPLSTQSLGEANLESLSNQFDSTLGGLQGELAADFAAIWQPGQAPDELGRIGKFKILRLLGAGGMGAVFLAEDTTLGRLVALKLMRPEFALVADAAVRFLREAKAAAAVRNDHIVAIYEFGQIEKALYIAQELLEGETLLNRLKNESPLGSAEALRIARECGQGLAAAHAKGVLHRDIKPSNIWLEAPRSRVKILDFGLARHESHVDPITQSGALVGTPAYMSPEQLRGGTITPRSDLFSLGCVLYQCLTGCMPFAGKREREAAEQLVDELVPPRELRAEIPPALSAFVMRLLASNPAQRPASAQEVVAAIAEFELLAESPRAAPTVSPSTSSHRDDSNDKFWVKRRWWLAGGLAGVFLLCGIVITIKDKDGKTVLSRVLRDGETVTIEPGSLPGAPAEKPDAPAIKPLQPAPAKEPNAAERDLQIQEHWARFGGEIYEEGDQFGLKWNRAGEKEAPGIGDFRRLRALSRRIVAVSFHGGALDRNALEGLAELPDVSNLIVEPVSIPDPSDLVKLKVHRALKRLSLAGESVDDQALKSLPELPNLEHLELYGAFTRSKSFLGLVKLKSLRYLSIASFDEVAIPPELAGLPQLTTLRLQRNLLGEDSAATVGKMRSLWQLQLQATELDDAGLRHLEASPQLTELRLGGTEVTDEGMASLSALARLIKLELRSTQIGDSGVAALSALPNLQEVDLSDTRVSDASIPVISQWKSLAAIWLNRTQLTAAGISQLREALPNLKIHWQPPPDLSSFQDSPDRAAFEWLKYWSWNSDSLPWMQTSDGKNWGGYTGAIPEKLSPIVNVGFGSRDYPFQFGDDDLAPLLACTEIETLTIYGARLTDKAIPKLQTLPKLTQLDINPAHFTDAGVRHFSELRKLELLELGDLELSETGYIELAKLPLQVLCMEGSPINAAVLRQLAKSTTLSQLVLREYELADADAAELEQAAHLKVLYFQKCGISDAAVARLRTTLPNCTIKAGP